MKNRKIALPTSDKEMVDEHFGHCAMFAIHTIEEKNITSIEYLVAPPHAPGVLPKFLGDHSVDTIITGRMGQRAIDLFHAQGIQVILGVSGTISENLTQYLDGHLESKGGPCVHDADHECHH